MQVTKSLNSQLEDRLKELISKEFIPSASLRKAANHIMLASCKRIRPKLLLSIAGEKGVEAACALEMVHTYSLIHDDLPCMDDDDERRGKPSVHVAFDEATAVLTGDALLTYAFQILAEAPYSNPVKVKLIQLLSQRSGPMGMIEGQCLDLIAKDKSINWKEYQTLAMRKTADLFSAAVEMGAIISGKSEDEIEKLRYFGHTFGLIFQIVDDLQDNDDSSITKIADHKKIISILKLLNKNAMHTLASLTFEVSFLQECLDLLTKRASV